MAMEGFKRKLTSIFSTDLNQKNSQLWEVHGEVVYTERITVLEGCSTKDR